MSTFFWPADLVFRPGGWVGDRVRVNESNWLIPLPAMNPGMVEMFAARDNLRSVNAPGDNTDPVPWAGEFAGKYLIGAVQSLRLTGNPELESVVRTFVQKLLATQGADGSLGMPLPWDVWGQYHVILGLLMWFDYSGEVAALTACKLAADLACNLYLNNPERIASDAKGDDEKNHSISHALALLFERTGIERYHDLLRAIEREWASDGCFRSDGTPRRCGDFINNALAGKAFCDGNRPRWEALHCVQAVARLFEITGDGRYRTAVENTWRSIRARDRRVTGGFSSFEEARGNPFDPRYIETCGTVAWMALTIDMLNMTGDSRAADELELSLFNGVMGAQSPDGQHWTYHTPMGGIPTDQADNAAAILGYRFPAYYDLDWQGRERYPQLSCCSANGPRGLGCLSEWAFMRGPDGIVINYYGPSIGRLAAPDGTRVMFEQETTYPLDGTIRIVVRPERVAPFTLHVRIPEWSTSTRLELNGEQQPCVAGSYAELRRAWRAGDTIVLKLDMRIRVAGGLRDAWGLAAAYRGPLLLAYDIRFDHFDPLAMPVIDFKLPAEVRTGGSEAALFVTFPSSAGKITLCDFASAGQAPPLPSRPDTHVMWQFSRSDGTVLAEQMKLNSDGTLEGHSHPNEARWDFDGDTLTFFTSTGLASTRFTLRLLENGKQLLSGWSLLDGRVRHMLSEVDLTILGKTWQFRRVTPEEQVLLKTVRLLPNGTFDVPTHPNETRWVMQGNTLVFFDANGVATTRFTSIRMRNGRVEWSGLFVPDSRIRHALNEVDLRVKSKLWVFPVGIPPFVDRDKVRLLPNGRLDGYRHDNEASWAPGNTRDIITFFSKSGAESTVFDQFNAAGGAMRFAGHPTFDPSLKHVLFEHGPGWAIPSSYVSWVPRPRLGIESAVFPTPSPIRAISTRPGDTSLYLVGLDEGRGGGRVWSKFFADPDQPDQWTGWFPLEENRFRPGSPVTALSTGPGATSLYVMGLDGQVWTNFFPSQVAGQWSGWMPLGPNTFPKESPIAAISTRPGGTSLFLVGLDEGQGGGRVWSKFFPDPDRPAQWTPWFPLGENRFRPGSPVTALSTGPGATSLYVMGLDGQVWTNFFPSQVAGQWSGWMPLGPNTFPKESPIAAISTRPGGTSLFLVGLDEGQGGGRVWSKFFPDPDRPAQWTGWFPLGESRFRPGSPVTALSTGPGATSLYVMGLDGQVWTNFFPSQVAGQWSGWMPLGPNTFPKGSPIAAISTRPGGTSLFLVGLDEGQGGGRVWSKFFPDPDRPAQWTPWFPL